MLDLGTGSGAVALALASERPGWRIEAIDLSPAALEVARRNANNAGLANVHWLQSDWFARLPARQGFDLIVSNPPYVAAEDPHLTRGDLRFEPRSALAAGVDGLDAIRRIVPRARAFLEPGGWLLLEHGYEQGPRVRSLLTDAAYEQITTRRDLANQERATGARLPKA